MELSKRDYFAAHALSGLLARPENASLGADLDAHSTVAAEAFLYADAMIKLSKTLMDPVEIDPNKLGKPEVPPDAGKTNAKK
jgi:hypothetical protein